MTLEKLRGRIKNEIVVQDGNIADWQWERTGLPGEAAKIGITNFLIVVNEIANKLNTEFGQIINLKGEIVNEAKNTYGVISKNQVINFIETGVRLGLDSKFMENEWIPKLAKSFLKEGDVLGILNSLKNNAEIHHNHNSKEKAAEKVTILKTLKETLHDEMAQYYGFISGKNISILIASTGQPKEVAASYIYEYLLENGFEPKKKHRGSTYYTITTSTDWWTVSYRTQYRWKIIENIHKDLNSCNGYILSGKIFQVINSTDYEKSEVVEIINNFLTKNSYVPKRKTRAKKVETIITSTDWISVQHKTKTETQGYVIILIVALILFVIIKGCVS